MSSSSCHVVAPLLFAAVAKHTLGQLEAITTATHSGLFSGASSLANIVKERGITTAVAKELNTATKMPRALHAAHAPKRHFTESGADKWLDRLLHALQAVAVGLPQHAPVQHLAPVHTNTAGHRLAVRSFS